MYGGIGTFTVLVIVALECSALDGSRRERLNDAVLELVPGFPLAAGWRFQRFCVSATGVLGLKIVATTVGQYHNFTRFHKFITSPTRTTHLTATTIDIFLTNCNADIKDAGTITFDLREHVPIVLYISNRSSVRSNNGGQMRF